MKRQYQVQSDIIDKLLIHNEMGFEEIRREIGTSKQTLTNTLKGMNFLTKQKNGKYSLGSYKKQKTFGKLEKYITIVEKDLQTLSTHPHPFSQGFGHIMNALNAYTQFSFWLMSGFKISSSYDKIHIQNNLERISSLVTNALDNLRKIDPELTHRMEHYIDQKIIDDFKLANPNL